MKALAAEDWISVRGNKQLGGYDAIDPLGEFPDPIFPDLPWEEIVRLAFRRHLIEREDHPIIKRTLGLV